MTDHEKLIKAVQTLTGYEGSDVDGLLRYMQRQAYASIFGMPSEEAERVRREIQKIRESSEGEGGV